MPEDLIAQGGAAAAADLLSSSAATTENLFSFFVQAFVFLLTVGFVGALLPLKARDIQQNRDRILSLGNVFSAGLFLTAGFIHMLGESIEGFDVHDVSIDNALLLCMLGIAVTLFVEKVLLTYYVELSGQTNLIRHLHSHSHASNNSEVDLEDDSKQRADLSATKPFHMYILIVLLSLHSIVEGLALGVEEQEADAQRVLMAIAAHKLFDGFALGLAVLRGGLTGFAYVRVVLIFALMSPVGIVLGNLFTVSLEPTDNIMSSGVQAFASGSFIYVALVEILLPEFDNRQDKLAKFSALLGGVALMLSL